MFALVCGLIYFLCPSIDFSGIEIPFLSRPASLQGGAGPNYRPISASEGFNYDSGDEEDPDTVDDDPTGRKRMLELTSLTSN